jgi:hypothetical protein
MKKFLLCVLLSFAAFFANAQVNYDNLQVSLLTVKPRPNEVYTVYGHTALRLFDPVNNLDAVLNWGTFNFHAPGFLYRFIKGETNYFLSVRSYFDFCYEYSLENATVVEQILRIPNENKEALLQMLTLNLEPENREYRYNFLFDNCTTRPRDIIEKFCGGNWVYPVQTEKTTFRHLIHSCTNPYPWMTFGIDLVIGSGADSLLTFRQELFLPEKLMNILEDLTVVDSTGEEYPLVVSSGIVVQSSEGKAPLLKFWDSPLIIGIVIFLIYLALAIISLSAPPCKRRGRKQKLTSKCVHPSFPSLMGKRWKCGLPFAFLLLVTGLAGCLVFSLSFFSYHPCTQYNWNLLWLHPLHFIGLAGFFLKKSYSLIRWYHKSNLLLLSFLLLAGFFLPQQLNLANIPYILCLGIVSGYCLLQLKKKKHE